MKIGQTVLARNVSRHFDFLGYPEDFGTDRDVTGKIIQMADFLDLRVLVEFKVEGSNTLRHVWKYATDVELIDVPVVNN